MTTQLTGETRRQQYLRMKPPPQQLRDARRPAAIDRTFDDEGVTPETPSVAVFCPEFFLPYSQTFIWDELRMHTRYRPDVFAVARKNEQRFPHSRVHTPGNMAQILRYLATSRCGRFDQAFRSRRFCLVHAHFGTGAVFAYPFAIRHCLPLVVTFHGYDVAILRGRARALPHRWRYWAMSGAILREAAALLCASEELCELVIQLGGRPAAVRLYQLGVDVGRYYRADEPRAVPRVTMIGRFVEKKGHLDGIAAFAHSLTPDRPAVLSIVGAGPLEERYRALVATLGIQSAVTFHGILNSAEIAALLARTDVLLAPSRVSADGDRESGLLVVREAGAAGVPVIGTYHGGIPETIDDGRTGYLVAERDIDRLSLRLRELLGDLSLRRQMGQAAQQRVREHFNLRSRVAELASIYDQILGAAVASPHSRDKVRPHESP
jgi:colanic acid/amylovoran biosynthesis glycosyltransferase